MPTTQIANNEIKALLNLLKDSEEKTLSLIAEQVGNFDDNSIRTLNELAEQSNDHDLLDNWYHVSRLSLAHRLKTWRKNPDLETGLFLVARLNNPALDEQHYRGILDNYAERVRSHLNAEEKSKQDMSKAINKVLFYEENFIGNQISYYDLNNNFINTVIDTKTGNPIMLSAIYILVARRLGAEVYGIGTPGHFVVQYQDKLLDPFFSGREITKDECIIRAQELHVHWREEYLDPVDDIAIFERCMRNLIAVYKKNNELEKAADVNSLLSWRKA